MTANADTVLGALNAGSLPGGAVVPSLPSNLDLENVADGEVVATATQQIDDGQTTETTTDVQWEQSDDAEIIGDVEQNPFGIIVEVMAPTGFETASP